MTSIGSNHDHPHTAGAQRVVNIMSWPATCASTRSTVRQALMQMQRGGFDHLLVTSRNALLGCLCHDDLIDLPPQVPAIRAAIPAEPVIAAPSNVSRAAYLFAQTGVCCLPVSMHDRTWGIITRGDIVRAHLTLPRCAACGTYHRVKVERGGVMFCDGCVDLGADDTGAAVLAGVARGH